LINIPLKELLSTLFVKILSIRVAPLPVILVGLVIVGKKNSNYTMYQ